MISHKFTIAPIAYKGKYKGKKMCNNNHCSKGSL